jgi:membrane-associated phospholipid phosphatase
VPVKSMRMKARALGCWLVLVGLAISGAEMKAGSPQDCAGKCAPSKVESVEKTQGKKRGKAKQASDRSSADPDPWVSSGRGFTGLGKDFLGDQKQMWTSPVRLRFSDADWLVPVGGFAAGLFVTDRDISAHLSTDPKTISHYKTISTAGVAALVGTAGGMWLLSYPAHREHWRESGFLAGEAAADSLVAVEALKYTLRRERPYQGDGSGAFFQGGTSFPSEHAAAAWAVAGVISHEYPGLLPKIAAYGLASLVSYSRIRGRQHFPSDVFIGGMIGQTVAQDVFSRHHDPELGGGEWRSLSALAKAWESGGTQNLGSPYVPLDSWIYPALDRLAALGLIDSAFSGLRPWTRRECMRQLIEAEDKLGNVDAGSDEASRLVEALQREFRSESEAVGDGSDGAGFRLESVYSRTEHISGKPLTNGYYLAQSQFDDFGRPYGQGWNTVNGFSSYSTWGPWVAYVRGEEESAPSIPAYSLATREAFQVYADKNQNGPHLPLMPGTPTAAVSQFQLLDTYVGVMLSNFEVSFGRQSLWWGAGQGGSLDFSDDIQPINMFRINRTTPLKLPSFLGWLGPMRGEFFLGQLAGQDFIFSPLGVVGQWGQSLNPQPLINGQHISFKPTRNFEFGFYRTTIFGGPGYPFTLKSFGRSLLSAGNAGPGTPNKPGNRTSAMDFSYRLPRLRDWVTFYGEAYTDDQFSPIGYMDRSAWDAGLFFSHLPRLAKMDLHVEGTYTDVPGGQDQIGPGSFYSDGTWRSGYTNNGYLIGNWVGRGGQGAQAWTNYWFNARNRLQFSFRHQKVSQQLEPGGGSLTDISVRGDYWVRPDVSISASVQYERWLFPVVQPNIERPVSATLQIQFAPQKLLRRPVWGGSETQLDTGGQP